MFQRCFSSADALRDRSRRSERTLTDHSKLPRREVAELKFLHPSVLHPSVHAVAEWRRLLIYFMNYNKTDTTPLPPNKLGKKEA